MLLDNVTSQKSLCQSRANSNASCPPKSNLEIALLVQLCMMRLPLECFWHKSRTFSSFSTIFKNRTDSWVFRVTTKWELTDSREGRVCNPVRTYLLVPGLWQCAHQVQVWEPEESLVWWLLPYPWSGDTRLSVKEERKAVMKDSWGKRRPSQLPVWKWDIRGQQWYLHTSTPVLESSSTQDVDLI